MNKLLDDELRKGSFAGGQQWIASFDDPVRPLQQRLRQGQTKCSCCLQIDHELELGWLLYREFGRLVAFKNLSTYIAARWYRSVVSTATAMRPPSATDSRNAYITGAIGHCKIDDALAVGEIQGAFRSNKRVGVLSRDLAESGVILLWRICLGMGYGEVKRPAAASLCALK